MSQPARKRSPATNRLYEANDLARVQLKNLQKTFAGDIHAVEDVNLEIGDGELVVLVGPSGCGKSTTLRMIAGLEDTTAGDIYIGDRRVNDVAPGDRDIAMVFQNYALYPHMTVRQNLAFGLKMRRTPKAEIHRRVTETAEILNIGELLDRRPRQLSGGQRQRVAVGRAIVRHPQVFLFDEPLSNLDAKLRGEMRTEIASLHNRLKTTMIYVTHDQVEAMTLGERIVIMHEGVVQQVDTPLNLYDRPANRFVASFIGSPAMNLLAGQLRNGAFELGGWRLPVGEGVAAGAATLGFRPEDVLAGDSQGVPLGKVKMDVVEQMGHETMVHFLLADHHCVARLPATADYRPGDEVELSLRLESWHLFASDEQGQRLA